MVADPLVLDRVVSNLVANASRYGRPPITVEAVQRDQFIRIVVSDSGDGIPEELCDALRPVRARDERTGERSRARDRKGDANAHGGELLYTPNDTGACFELILPRG